MKLLYIGNIRLPTEKAHGLQIMQNCEAFADAGVDVSLWAARRVNTPALRDIGDLWEHYGVKRNFTLRRLPCLDLMSLTPYRSDAPAKLVFLLQQWSFTLAAFIAAIVTRDDIYYSRDESVMLTLSLIKPRRALAYEAHSLARGRMGRWLQRQTVRRAGHVFATTRRLADDLVALGAEAARVHVAHDGVRAERFADLPDQAAARAQIGWPADAFIVGYVGRLQTMAMDKGVGLLVDALARVDGLALGLVGGPDEIAEALRAQWLARGLPPERFLYAGQVAPAQVPVYLRAFDIGAMPFPWIEHFAYYASPIKLFEYMAARRAVVASDLPSTAEVVRDGESALLYPPGDLDALVAALMRLRDDASLRDALAARAQALVMADYTWAARARHILSAISGGPDED